MDRWHKENTNELNSYKSPRIEGMSGADHGMPMFSSQVDVAIDLLIIDDDEDDDFSLSRLE